MGSPILSETCHILYSVLEVKGARNMDHLKFSISRNCGDFCPTFGIFYVPGVVEGAFSCVKPFYIANSSLL